MSVLLRRHDEAPPRQIRECLGLLLKVLSEHDPGVLERCSGTQFNPRVVKAFCARF